MVEKGKIEMLFVHPDARGTGIGRKLTDYAPDNYKVKYVDVNEQNTQASVFYRHLGFKVISRSERDSQGNPFPILHMEYAPER